MKNNSIEFSRKLERVRQEKEIFDQRKKQDNKWFTLKLSMGFSAIGLLASIFVIAAYILLNSEKYSSMVVGSASTALFADIIGTVITVYKIVLNPTTSTKFEPITKDDF